MRIARTKIGQPKPLADQRYRVQAFWDTIRIRFVLADLAQAWLRALRQRDSELLDHFKIWAEYISFILQSCGRDAALAIEIAKGSGSHRQVAETSLFVLQTDLKLFCFNVYMAQTTGVVKDKDVREKLLSTAATQEQDSRTFASRVIATHMQARRGKTDDERAWLDTHFVQPARAILDEWDAIKQSTRADTFYQPVSREDMIAIVEAFKNEFSHTGHFYQCPNGHTYVIGECGGAMQQASCMECGAPIGGQGHNLESTNTRNMDMENIAREQYGAQRSPWR